MPSEPIFLHVGLPKTGTTDLQRLLWANRRRLAAKGVLYPGADSGAQFQAALDVLGSKMASRPGAWDSMAKQAKASTGRVVLSHEMLAGAGPDVMARIVSDLAPRDLHVVLTVRDFSRIVSATWQERAKNRQVEPWGPFLEHVARGPEGGHAFWRLQDASRVVRQWAEHVPGDRIHVITVPPLSEDPHLLLRRFAEVVGFTLEYVEVPDRPANQSLGALEIAVLQQVNAVSSVLDWEEYRRMVKNYLVPEVLAARGNQVRVVLPEHTRGWVEAETTRIRDSIEQAGCRVLGDLGELDPRGIGSTGASTTETPDALSAEEVLAASSEAVIELVRSVDRLRAKQSSRQAQAARTSAAPAGGARPAKRGRSLKRRLRSTIPGLRPRRSMRP